METLASGVPLRVTTPKSAQKCASEIKKRDPLADTALDIVGKIVTVIFRLPERHLQHKEPLRGWFKPKCRKAQRHNLASVYGVNYSSTVNTVTREAIGMPRQYTDAL